jgi:hypothetical protein
VALSLNGGKHVENRPKIVTFCRDGAKGCRGYATRAGLTMRTSWNGIEKTGDYMKSLIFAFILAAGLGSVVHAEKAQPADAYGYCYHFYNCQGTYFSGGYFSGDDCTQMGGLSVQEGSYCENLPNPNDQVRPTAVQPLWFGTCYYAMNCVGMSMGTMGDTQCESMGGHSINSGGACIDL